MRLDRDRTFYKGFQDNQCLKISTQEFWRHNQRMLGTSGSFFTLPFIVKEIVKKKMLNKTTKREYYRKEHSQGILLPNIRIRKLINCCLFKISLMEIIVNIEVCWKVEVLLDIYSKFQFHHSISCANITSKV